MSLALDVRLQECLIDWDELVVPVMVHRRFATSNSNYNIDNNNKGVHLTLTCFEPSQGARLDHAPQTRRSPVEQTGALEQLREWSVINQKYI